MIDQKTAKIADDRLRIEIEEQNDRLGFEIERIKAKMAAQGTLRSSTMITLVAGLCIDAVKFRAQFVWQTLFRFVMTTGISYSSELAYELKNLVAQHLPEKLDDLRCYIKQTAEMAGSQGLYERLEKDLDRGRKQALAKIGTEIDLFALSLKKKTEIEKDGSSSTIFNIYSPVGSIQTGNNSISYLTLNIDTEVKELIRKTLEEINSKLNQPEVETHSPKSELIEVVQESQLEIQKEKPNVTRLRSLLTCVGTSIQVVSSLKPAYDTLKQALTFLGISLP